MLSPFSFAALALCAPISLPANPGQPARQETAPSPPAPATEEAVPEETLALVGGTIHTQMPGETPRVGTLLIRGERIIALGADVVIPEGAKRVDVTGMHLVPALIDGLVNFDPAHDLLYTATGVGFVRDIGGDPTRLVAERDPEQRARSLGPSMATAGAVLDGDPPSSSTAAVLRTPEEAESNLKLLFDEGVDFLSVQFGLTDEVRRRVIELAHARGLEVWGPRPRSLSMQDSIAEGQDGYFSLDALLPVGLDWTVVQQPAFKKSIAALAEADRPVIPLFYASVLRLENQAARPDTEALFTLLSPTYTSWWQAELEDRAARLSADALALGERVVKKQAALLKALFDGGVSLLPGTGTPQPWVFPGRALHQELELWQEAGIPAADVLDLATHHAAVLLHIEEDFGSLAPGRIADILVLDDDPSEDIGRLRDQAWIVVRGQVIDADGIQDMLQSVAGRMAKVKESLNRVIDVPAPAVPEGSVVVLDGTVDTVAYGLRLWSEHFSVARLMDGGIAYLGRVIYPEAPGEARTPREMLVREITHDGELTSATIVLKNDGQELRFEGLWTAGSWRMRRLAGVRSLGVTSNNEHPIVVDTGSIVTELVLGQAPLSDRFSVIALHEGLEPEAAMWKMELDDVGNHQVRTHTGRLAFRFSETGAPLKGLSVVGTRALENRLRTSTTYGGPGLPLPKGIRDEIALREESRPAEAQAPQGVEAESGSGASEGAKDAADSPPGGAGDGDTQGGTQGTDNDRGAD